MTITDYRNFDLLITRSGDRYRAIVVESPAGEDSASFDLPAAAGGLSDLGGLVRGNSRAMDQAPKLEPVPGPPSSLADLGQRLYTAIFPDKLSTLLAASLSSVAKEGAGLRLRLRFEEDAAGLATLPWEILYDPAQAQFIGLGERSPILRYLALPRSRSALLVEPPLRVLAVLASPADLPALNTKQEWQAIQDALAGLVADGKFVLERLAAPTLAALQERLLGEPVHILHFVGHGIFDAAAGAGCLVLEDARSQSHLVRGEQLAALLRNHPAMRLAYLNACEGALASGGSVFTGLAQTLVREGVPAAVAMQAEISDAGAVELARTFYTALAAGRPVDAALTQARVALSAADSPEWAIPVLFSRSPDNRLFDIRQVLPTPDCPYPGMTPFGEAQRDLFFGRDKEIEDAVERLRQHPFLTVVGPSGSGKSSLIYAGVIPALRRSKRFGPGAWDIKIMRPGDSRTADGKAAPMQALAQLLNLSPQSPVPDPPSPTLLFVDQFEETFTLAGADEAQAFLDTLNGLIGRPNLHILLTVRADFYPELMASSLWQPIRANRLELTPLGDDALWAAIVEPAARVGVEVDEALAVKLIADASGQKGVLPLVQETLVLLWDKVKGRRLKLEAYKEMGETGRSGLQVAIDRRATTVYHNLPDAAQPIARRIFLRLIQFGEGRADTRRQQTAAELRASGDDPALFDQTLVKLIEGRLLTASGDAEGAERRVDIAHEALIAGWPRLQAWLDQRRAAEQTRRRLEAKAAEWVAAEKRGGLLDEYELQEAESWLAGEDAQELGYSQELVDLVVASKVALAGVEAEKEAQRQRELAQAQKLAEEQRLRAEEGERAASSLRKRFRLAVAAATIALILLAVAGVAVRQAIVAQDRAETEASEAERQRSAAVAAQATAVASADEAELSRQMALRGQFEADYQRQLAEQRQLEAEARSLAAQAERLQAQDPALALLLAGEAAQQARRAGKAPLVEIELMSPLKQWELARRADNALPVEVVSTLHRLLAAPHAQLLRDIKAHDAHVWSVALWPDETKFVTAGCDQRLPSGACQSGQARVWDIDGALLAEFANRPTDLSLAVVSPNGERVLTDDDLGGVQLWAANDLREIAALPGYTGTLSAAVFSPDDQRILTVGEREPARLWSAQGQLLAALDAATQRTYSAVFSPDGQRIASSHCTSLGDNQTCAAGYARLWDADGRPLTQFAQGAGVRWVSFGPGGVMVSAECAELANGRCIEDMVRVWDPAGQLLSALEGRRFFHPLRHVEFDASGTRILAYSATEAALWTSAGELLAKLDASTNHLWTVRFSPDGQLIMIVSSGPDPDRFNQYKTLIQLRNRDGAFLLDLPARHEGFVKASAMTANHGRLLSAGLDGLVQIWDTGSAGGTLQGQRPGHTGFLRTAVYSPDGSRLATVADDGVRLWDAEGNLLAHLETRAPQVYAARFSRQGDLLATLACDVLTQNNNCARGALRLWDADGAFVREVTGYRFAGGYDFAPDGSYMATAGEGSTAQVLDASGQRIALLTGHTGPVNRVAYSPDGARIGTSSDDGTVRIWDAGGQPLMTLSGHTGPTRGVLFGAAKDAIMTYGNDGSIRLWSDDGQMLHVLDGHPGGVKFATFNRTGTLILSESNDGPARLWDIDGNLIAVLGENAAWVDVAAFDPAGERIMTVECNAVNEGDWCIRHSVNLWDTRGEFITTVDTHWVEWAVFHPDGRQIATAGCDTFEPPTNTRCLAGGIWLWQAYPDVDALLAEAETRAGRALTPAECQQYLGLEQCP